MGDLTENFSRREFECPCCGRADMKPSTLIRLQELRDMYGRPIRIAEGGGYRCQDYPGAVKSAHREGRAVDPIVPREDLYQVIELAFKLGFGGIGVKNVGGRWQLHLDDATSIPGVRPRPWLWTYD